MMIKNALLMTAGLFSFSLFASAQTNVSQLLYAKNYWQPNRSPFTGKLDATYWDDVAQSGAKYMRVGGIAYDAVNNSTGTTHIWTALELASDPGNIIAEIRSHGLEPIIQVPIDITQTVAQNAAICSTLVADVNNTYSANVSYWEIGNEPNGAYAGAGGYNTTTVVATYIKDVSTAMKGVSGQSGIKIIGPALSYYDYGMYETFLLGTGCSTCNIAGTISPGIYYIDYISFHSYPLQGESNLQSKTRSDVITHLRSAGQFDDILDDIISMRATAGRSSTLGIMVTEANVSYQQDRNNRGVGGIGPGSFWGGQFWSEMIEIGMAKGVASIAPWSVIEGTSSGGSDYLTDIGYISSQYSTNRSTYWHYKLMADYFKTSSTYTTTFYPGTVKDGSGNLITDVKAFASKVSGKSQVVLTIMNQKDIPGSYSFEARTNNATASTSSNFNITLSTGTSYTATGTLAAEETQWLVYNCNGVYEGKWVYNVDDNINNSPPDWIDAGVAASNSVTSTCSSGCTGLSGSNVTIGISGATTVTWIADPNLTPVGSYSASITITPNDPYYTFISTASTGCTYTKDVQVTHSIPIGPPYASVTNITHATCGAANGSATVTGGGCSPFTYSWSTGATTATVTGLSAGTYTVTASCWSYPYSASFLAVIQNNVTPVTTMSLSSQTISSSANYIASETITAGPSLTVGSGTTVHFTAGENVHMGDGFSVTGTTNFRATVRKTNCMEPQ